MALLTKELDLTDLQQSAVRKLLLNQRDQIAKLWDDSAVPAPYRISATKAIGEQTADSIRLLLNDEQKKKYNPPRPTRPAADSDSRSVEQWMQTTTNTPPRGQ